MKTHDGYRAALKWWTDFCASQDVEPWSARFDVWEKAVTDGRSAQGHRLTWDYYKQIERAVAEEHHRRGLTPPAPRAAAHAYTWSELGEAYRRRDAGDSCSGAPARDRDPLMRENIAAMLAVLITDLPETSTSPQSGRGRGLERVAQRLVLLDTGCSSFQLAKTAQDQVTVEPDGVSVKVAGEVFFLRHDHIGAAETAGVPWDCAACAVVARLTEIADAPEISPFPKANVLETTAAWPGLVSSSTRLKPVDGTSVRERAGLRRGLVLSAHRPKEWAWWLLARAWVAMSWEAGFRMSGDLGGLDRSWCTALPAGDGYRIQLHSTKDDQAGTKRVTRPLLFDPDGGPSAASMLSEYLAVRDARLGSGGSLMWWNGYGTRADRTVSWAAGRCVRTLVEAAQVVGNFTAYSARKGYSAQSAADGRDPELRQRGLRQQSVRTTLQHYPDASDSLASNVLMMSRILEKGGRS